MKLTLSRPKAVLDKLSFGALSLSALFLLIEFFDELHYGIQGAVLPSLRNDLGLSYGQVGLLLGLPHLAGTLVEPAVMLLGDTPLRKRLVLGGGAAIILAVLLTGSAWSFPAVLAAFFIAFPASGAFVTLSQATLVDAQPGREAHSMARWTLAGSLGNVIGPLMVAGGFALGVGWRWNYFLLAGLALALVLLVLPRRFPAHPAAAGGEQPASARAQLSQILRGLWAAARNPALLRWLILLEFSDLLLDMFSSYVPLYFVDVLGATPVQTGLALTALTVAHLLADMALIPLLERFPGRRLVRLSALLAVPVYIAWLLAPWLWLKLALTVLIPFCTLGWYPVLEGETFAAVPGRSGTVKAVSALGGVLTGLIAWAIGAAANAFGLPAAMTLLLAGPLALVLFVPREE